MKLIMATISANLQAVRARIARAAAACGRVPDTIDVLAVSKAQPAACVLEAVAAGQTTFGENYVQEGVEKIEAVGRTNLEWHFIGPLQSNKTREVAEAFSWVHTIDRLKIAERLSQQRPEHLPPLQVCLQINVSGEDSKSGIAAAEAARLAHDIVKLPRLRLRGLMAIPAPSDDPIQQRSAFRSLHRLFEQLRSDGFDLDTLSMGMSNDIEAAVAEGATLLRIGTAIFGERKIKS